MCKNVWKIYDKNKFSKVIVLYDESFFKLNNKAISKFSIKENKNIDNFDEILKLFIYPAIKHKLIELLSKKDYSYNELSLKIKDYGYSESYSKTIIDEFVTKGYINDLEYASNLIEKYSKKYGEKKIKYLLYQKGLDQNTIDLAINNSLMDFNNTILSFINKYSTDNYNDIKFKNKIINKLMYKGFSYTDITNVIDNYIKNKA